MADHCYAECHLCYKSLMLGVTYKSFMLCCYAECRYAECGGAINPPAISTLFQYFRARAEPTLVEPTQVDLL
jgi:hypothetical protein